MYLDNMYFNITVIILTLFVIFLILLEINEYSFETFENPFMKRNVYNRDLTPKELSYNKQYLNILKFDKINNSSLVADDTIENTETIGNYLDFNNKSHIFNEDNICKDLDSNNPNKFSITRELNCKDIDDYLLSIVKINNNKIKYNFPLDNKLLTELKVDDWNEKQILNKNEYQIKQQSLLSNVNQKYINKDNIIKYVDIAVNNFVDLMNKHFEESLYNEKYNKHHVFESYKLQHYDLKNYYTYNTTLNETVERTIVVFKIHRTYKINDFIILLDIFYKPHTKKQEKQTRLNNFEDNYNIYYKNAYVIGNPIRHHSRYLEPDDTNFVISNFKILTEEMHVILHNISKLNNNNSDNNEDIKYKEIVSSFEKVFNEIRQINNNKSFNNIIYKQLLFRLKKIIENYEKIPNFQKSEKIILYEELVIKFIANAKTILEKQDIQQTDLDTDIDIENPNKINFSDNYKKVGKQKNIIHNTNINKLLNKHLIERNGVYKCFNPKYQDKILDKYNTRASCLSYKPELNTNGVWDKYCTTDSECPFYQANQNYPNDFGGCIEGKCQMPIGLSVIGGTKVSDIGEPYCYNCGKYNDEIGDTYQETGRCCGKQFKKLKSPDFMFTNDKKLRYKHRSFLHNQNLKP